MSDVKTFGVVTTIANEEDTLEKFVEEIFENTKNFNTLIFLVFDHVTTDNSYKIAQRLAKIDPRIIVLFDKASSCPRESYFFGFHNALAKNCDLILDINGGFRHQPAEIQRFIQALTPEVDCVIGSRFCEQGAASFKYVQRYVLSFYGTKIANMLLGSNLTDYTSGYHLFTSSCLADLCNFGVNSRFHFMQTEMRHYIAKQKIYREVPISYISSSAPLKWKVVFEAAFELVRLSIRSRRLTKAK